jgi:hypothetical protein
MCSFEKLRRKHQTMNDTAPWVGADCVFSAAACTRRNVHGPRVAAANVRCGCIGLGGAELLFQRQSRMSMWPNCPASVRMAVAVFLKSMCDQRFER